MAEDRNNISETIIIGPDCQERFLPLHLPEVEVLHRRGIRLGGLSVLRPPYEIGRAPAPSHTLLCTTAGSGRWRCADAEGVIEPATLWWFPAGLTYGYRVADVPWTMHWLHLDAGRDWGVAAAAPLLLGEPPTALREAMAGLIAEEHSEQSDAQETRRLYAELIWIWLARTLRRRNLATDPLDERLAALWGEVSAKLGQPWSVATLAARAHLSVSHLHRLVRARQGRTPMQHLTELRMQRAASLLTGTRLPLGDIAAAVGYQTPFAFSRTFKRHRGHSPRAFRQRGY